MTTIAPIPAGWYADPWNEAPHRWWDGSQWTAHVSAPSPAPAYSPYAQPQPNSFEAVDLLVPRAHTWGVRALVWGIIAVVLPIAFLPSILALVFGISSLVRHRRAAAQGYNLPHRGFALTGTILGGIGLVIVLLLIAVLTAFGRN